MNAVGWPYTWEVASQVDGVAWSALPRHQAEGGKAGPGLRTFTESNTVSDVGQRFQPLGWQAAPCTSLLPLRERLIKPALRLCSQAATVDLLETQQVQKVSHLAHWPQVCRNNPGKGSQAQRCFRRAVGGRALLYSKKHLSSSLARHLW